MKIGKVYGYESRINLVNKVDNYVMSMLDKHSGVLEEFAKRSNTTINLAQKGDLLLINSGQITSHLNLKKMDRSEDFYQKIYQNVKDNVFVKTKGLQSVLNK